MNIWSWFHISMLIGFQMRALEKSCQEKYFYCWNIAIFWKRQKTPKFDKAPWQYNWTKIGSWGNSWRTLARSFIWYPRKWSRSSGLAVDNSWKSWPLPGREQRSHKNPGMGRCTCSWRKPRCKGSRRWRSTQAGIQGRWWGLLGNRRCKSKWHGPEMKNIS